MRECDFLQDRSWVRRQLVSAGCSWRGFNIASSLSRSTTKRAGQRNQEIMYRTQRGQTRGAKKPVSGSVQLKVFSVGNRVADYKQAVCGVSRAGRLVHCYYY